MKKFMIQVVTHKISRNGEYKEKLELLHLDGPRVGAMSFENEQSAHDYMSKNKYMGKTYRVIELIEL